ncbi:glycosyltransferase family 4 protein [Geobacter sp. AOG1]|uniref:glycosyltransferase family 4 protein n=1 Tax=Geobacter sp. AOG1 TaxID=1566346 RepID=UPI001CC6444D|nr:glycosyltransferase family 4 protein [Geobacter sp. AOG1]
MIKTFKDLFLLAGLVRNYDLVVINPSLDAKAVIRDGIYHILVKRIMQKKTLVFFHGWDLEFEQKIDRYFKRVFKTIFNFDRSLVLARLFKDKLISWGFHPEKIDIETTVYEHYDLTLECDVNKIVFLSRFVREKGCMVAIQIVEILSKQFPEIKLFMAGDGPMASELKEYVRSSGLVKYVEFTGWLEGIEKHRLLKLCGIMLYPTAFGEGLPICLLEGMGTGLAIVTRPVAGIPDIFEEGENGFLIESLNLDDYVEKIRFLLNNKKVWQEISNNNRKKAIERFEIRSVAKRLDRLYYEVAHS